MAAKTIFTQLRDKGWWKRQRCWSYNQTGKNSQKWTSRCCVGRWSLTPSNPRKGCQNYVYGVLVDTWLRKTAWHYKAEEVRLGEKVALWSRNTCPPGKWVWVHNWSWTFPFYAVSECLLGSMSSLVTGKAYQPSNLPTTLLIQKVAKAIQRVLSNYWSAWISAWCHIYGENSAIGCICVEDFEG